MLDPTYLFEFGPVLSRLDRAKGDLIKRGEGQPFVIAVDLDGTLTDASGPYDPTKIGPPRPNALKAMHAFKEAGAILCIYTVRGTTDLIARWLADHKIPYDYINESPIQPADSSNKMLADVYFDDRAISALEDDAYLKVLERIYAT